MANYDDGESHADREIIRSARREATAAVRDYNHARASAVTGARMRSIKRSLADAALNLYDALYEYRDESALSEKWERRGITWLEEAANETTPVEKQLPRANGGTRTVERPKLVTVDGRELHHAIRELNDIANELGFSPAAKETTPQDEADISDLRGLLKARGQTEALKNLPPAESDGGDA